MLSQRMWAWSGLEPMKIALWILLMLLAPLILVTVCHGAAESDARAAVTEAQERISVCYNAAADAAKAGANVTSLLSTLNDAGNSLSKAELALGQGDFSSAYNLANESEGKLNGFENVASGLKDSAVKAGNWDFQVNVVGSSVGSVIVLASGFVVWYLLRKKYPGVA
jgi:hypothetical protein